LLYVRFAPFNVGTGRIKSQKSVSLYVDQPTNVDLSPLDQLMV
jgi:hypothetical protein